MFQLALTEYFSHDTILFSCQWLLFDHHDIYRILWSIFNSLNASYIKSFDGELFHQAYFR